MQAVYSQEMIDRVSKCIEYDNIEIKKEKRSKKATTPLVEKQVSAGM